MAPLEHIYPTTPSPGYLNTTTAQAKFLNFSSVKIIECFKEKMNISHKDTQGNTMKEVK